MKQNESKGFFRPITAYLKRNHHMNGQDVRKIKTVDLKNRVKRESYFAINGWDTEIPESEMWVDKIIAFICFQLSNKFWEYNHAQFHRYAYNPQQNQPSRLRYSWKISPLASPHQHALTRQHNFYNLGTSDAEVSGTKWENKGSRRTYLQMQRSNQPYQYLENRSYFRYTIRVPQI